MWVVCRNGLAIVMDDGMVFEVAGEGWRDHILVADHSCTCSLRYCMAVAVEVALERMIEDDQVGSLAVAHCILDMVVVLCLLRSAHSSMVVQRSSFAACRR